MTERLYYTDSHTTAFTGRIIERIEVEGRPAVVLDCSYFYPTGGGQPHDTGTLDEATVLDVFSRDGDNAVVHVLDRRVVGKETVSCQVNWDRRFDHMQHHTGQHILTQAFAQIAGAHTVSFHLSPDSVTIDLDVPTISPDTIARVEDLANQIVFENRPVVARFIDPDDAEGVRIRRMPNHLLAEGLRVVQIEGFDSTACGGTHVARTGEIGLIKVIAAQKRGAETRIEFLCGGRALRDYRAKSAVLAQLTADLTCGYWEIDQAIARLRSDLKTAQRALKTASAQLIEYEAERLLVEARKFGNVQVIRSAFTEREVSEVRTLASRLIQTPGTVVLLGVSGGTAHVILARSADLPYDMNEPLRHALGVLGETRGGGRPEFVQGGGVRAGVSEVERALKEAERALFGAG